MYQGRGSGLINQLRVEQYLILGGAIKVLFPNLIMSELILMGVLFMVGTTFLGWYDKTHFKLWQRELELNKTHVDPYNQRIESKIDKIIKSVKK